MQDLTTHLARVSTAQTVEELWELHCARMQDYGFDRLIYGFTRFRTHKGLGDPQDWIVLSNLPEAYLAGYVDEGLFQKAPMLCWALEHEGACSWRELKSAALACCCDPADAARARAFNLSHGIKTGYTISFHSVSRRCKGAMALIAREELSQDAVDAMWAELGLEIEVQNTMMHLKLLTLPYSEGRKLTRRQREVLEWVGDGKTTQDIAQIMGLTPATVEKHMRLAREAMDVDTTAQAVLKAAFHNQMFVHHD